MKTIKISEATHKALSTIKIDSAQRTLDETIINIIHWYEWWVKPGPKRGPQTMTIEEYREAIKNGKLK